MNKQSKKTQGRLPNMIIAGASKSGSTSLFEQLRKHPQCYMSDKDNLNFFLREKNMEKLDEYRGNFTPNHDRDPEIISEGTALYLFDHAVPRRMKNHLSDDLKLIFILRNPGERAVSNYWHFAKKFEDKRSLEEVFNFKTIETDKLINEEKRRVKRAEENGLIKPERLKDRFDAGKHLIPYYHLRNSFYSRHLEPYFKEFPSEDILLILTEEFQNAPEKTYQKITRFLDIDSDFTPDNLREKYNKSYVPRQDALSKFFHDTLKLNWPDVLKFSILKKIYRKITFHRKPPTPQKLQDYLDSVFLQEQKILAENYDLPTQNYWDLG